MVKHIQLTIGRTFYLKVEEGENPLDALRALAEENGIDFALVNGIGGMGRAKIGIYTGKGYEVVEISALEGRALEAIGFQGNIVRSPRGRAYPHIHVALARRSNEVYAGHLVDAVVKPFMEIFVLEVLGEKTQIHDLFKHRWQ